MSIKDIIENIEQHAQFINESLKGANSESKIESKDFKEAINKIKHAIKLLKKHKENLTQTIEIDDKVIIKLEKLENILHEKKINNKDFLASDINELQEFFPNYDEIIKHTSSSDKFLSTIGNNDIIKGYVLYCFNADLLNMTIRPLLSIKPILDIENYRESYLLDTPAFTIEGKPIWFLIKNIPISLNFNFKGNTPLLLELQLKGMDAHTIHAKKTSQHHENIYRTNKKFGRTEIILILCSHIIAGLIWYIIYYNIFTSLLGAK